MMTVEILCCVSCIIFQIKLVQTERDLPKEGTYATPVFEDQMPKNHSIMLQVDRIYLGLRALCYTWSGFCIHSYATWASQGSVWIHGFQKERSTVAKEFQCHDGWLSYAREGSYGYQKVKKATIPKYPICPLWLSTMADSKHTSIRVITWATTHKYSKWKG